MRVKDEFIGREKEAAVTALDALRSVCQKEENLKCFSDAPEKMKDRKEDKDQRSKITLSCYTGMA